MNASAVFVSRSLFVSLTGSQAYSQSNPFFFLWLAETIVTYEKFSACTHGPLLTDFLATITAGEFEFFVDTVAFGLSEFSVSIMGCN